MTLKGMYHKTADHYSVANRFGSISQSHEVAIDQIRHQHLDTKPSMQVLDMGVGTGEFIKKLHAFLPQAKFTGIDVSSKMLSLAEKQGLPLTTIETNACKASKYLPAHSQDLVLAHFVNAYIPIPTLFSEARILTKDTGYFSLITTTFDSFPEAQRQLAEFISKDTLVSRVVGHYYKAIVKNSTVAANQELLVQAFNDHTFKVVEHQRIEIPITLNTIEELINFGIEGTWFLNSVTIRMLPRNFLIERLKRLFDHIFTFPYHDKHIIDIVLASK